MTKRDNNRDFMPCDVHRSPPTSPLTITSSNNRRYHHLIFHYYPRDDGLEVYSCPQSCPNPARSTATTTEYPPHRDHGFHGPRRRPARHDSRGGPAAADAGDSAFEPESEPNSEWLIFLVILIVALRGDWVALGVFRGVGSAASWGFVIVL